MIEKQIEIETAEGSMTTFEFHPEEGGPYPLVLYLMDAPSIRPALRGMASRLASAGYYVLCPSSITETPLTENSVRATKTCTSVEN